MPQARLGTGRKPLGPDTNLGFVWLCHSEQYSINLFCFVFLLTSHPRGGRLCHCKELYSVRLKVWNNLNADWFPHRIALGSKH
jgi:hypothetical protein